SQIGSHADLDAFGAKDKSNGIGSIVRNGEREHFDVADGKALARAEVLAAIEMSFVVIFVERGLLGRRTAYPALPFLMGMSGDVNRNLQLARQHAKSADMIRMFVSDHDRAELRGIPA